MTPDSNHTRTTVRSALLKTGVAVHGPYGVLAAVMTLFVACDHCRAAAWSLLPVGPGLIPYGSVRQWLGWPHPSDGMGLLAAGAMTLLEWGAVFLAVRRGGRMAPVVRWGVLVLNGILATGLYFLLRA